MAYKLHIKESIQSSGLSVLEVSKKIGISYSKLLSIDNRNDIKINLLFLIAETINCKPEELWSKVDEEIENLPNHISKKIVKKNRINDIYSILTKRLPEEIELLADIMKCDELQVCTNLWNERFTDRAKKRIARITKDESRFDEIIKKVRKIKAESNM